MTDLSTLNVIRQQAADALLSYRISEGLFGLEALMRECPDQQLSNALENIRDSYTQMLHFLSQGGHDEERADIQDRLVRQALHTLDSAARLIRLSRREDLYAHAHHQLFLLGGQDAAPYVLQQWDAQQGTAERYETQDLLFDLLWTAPLWDQRQTASWFEFISRQDTLVQQHLVGAVILSACEYMDAEKLIFLSLMADSEQPEVRALSLTGLVLLLLKYEPRLSFYPALLTAFEGRKRADELALLQRELILMQESPKASQAIAQEMAGIDFVHSTPQQVEERIRATMKRYRALIVEGVDIDFHKATLLHSSQFLRRISHWWAPFDESRPFLQELFIRKDGDMAEGLRQMFQHSADCSVNRYAICEAMLSHSDVTSIDKQLTQLWESIEANLADTIPQQVYFRSVVQNMARFFAHSPLAQQTESLFASDTCLPRHAFLRPLLSRQAVMQTCQMLIHFHREAEAFPLLQQLSRQEGVSAEMLRLMGRCQQQMGQWQKAVNFFTQADLLDENDTWTLQQLNVCYERLQRHAERLDVLQRLEVQAPDDLDLSLQLADCLVHLGRADEALNLLYKVELYRPEDATVLTTIAHSALRLGRTDVARKYLQKRLSLSAPLQSEETLMAARVQLVIGRWREALQLYAPTADETFEAEREPLAALGFPLKDFALLRDMRQQLREKK